MSRPVDPVAQYRVKPHVTHGYTYASTRPPFIDPNTGKKKYPYVHWGTIDENLKFIPGTPFYQASPEERAQLIFPEEWDMSNVDGLIGRQTPEAPILMGKYQNRLYGDVWLLEQVAIKTGIMQDLNTVFDGNCEIVGDILTLAMFPYLTNYTYNCEFSFYLY